MPSDNNNSDSKVFKLSELRKKLQIRETELHTDLQLLDDAFLMKYLNACDHDVNLTSDIIINYFQIRLDYPELFQTADNPKVRAAFKQGLFYKCPNYNDQFDGSAVIFFKPGNWNEQEVSAEEMLAGALLRTEFNMMDPRMQTVGVSQIEDPSGMTLAKLWRMPMSMIRLMSKIMEHSLPVKINSINIVNEHYVFHAIFNLFKPFLSARLRSRFALLGSYHEGLFKKFEPKCIPIEFGGEWDPYEEPITDESIDHVSNMVEQYWKRYPVIKK